MPSPRPRPFVNLGNADLVKQLFDAAFASNAALFEDLLFELEGNARVIIRPSGTEPKVKAYLQSVIQVIEGLTAARAQADTQIGTLEADVRTWLR